MASELTLDDLTAEKQAEPCKVAKLVERLSDSERTVIETALAESSKQYPHTKIAAALSKRVEYVSDTIVRRHRIGSCSCAR